MTKTLTELWLEGKLPEDCYYILTTNGHIRKERTCFYSHTEEQCFCFMSNKDVKEVLAPVPSYEEWQSYDKCADMLIDVNKKWHKTIVENKKLKNQLEIATNALKEFKEQERNYLDYGIDKDGNKIYLYPNRVATKALKEIKEVK